MENKHEAYPATLRQAGFTAEMDLWNAIKSRQISGHKFTRQFPIGTYFADFACRSQMLVVELDGSQHQDQLSYDQAQDKYMVDCGYSVLRLKSVSALTNRDGLCDSILAALEGRL